MKRWIMIRRGEQIFSAWMQDQTLIQIQADPAANDGILGNIYVGKVKNIVKFPDKTMANEFFQRDRR